MWLIWRLRYNYDALNRLTTLTTEHNGTTTERYSYTLDATGKRTAMNELNGRYTQWTYNNLNRLTAETITQNNAISHSASYQYDATGNRSYQTVNGVSTAYSYDANDQLQSAGGITYSYDNNGNTLTETDSVSNTHKTYSYNAKNELIAANDGATQTSFAYDIDGIRNQKSASGITTSYITDKNRDYAQVLLELENGNAVASYTYGDDLISQQAANDTSFYLYDGLGSTRALSNAAGAITDTYEYAAFGETLNSTGATPNNYRYTGEQFDEGLDQYYLRARYYNQDVGRFTQRDTWGGSRGKPITLNKMLYADADPINLIDPSGNMSMGELGVARSVQGTLNTIVTPNLTRQLAGRAANHAGKSFENKIFNAIKSCLKPGAHIQRTTKDMNLRDAAGRLAMPDFMLSIGNKFKILEVKTKLPTGHIPEALDRAAKQLDAALQAKYPTAILSKAKHRDSTLAKRKDEIERKLGQNAGMATYLNGTVEVMSFIGEFVLEECVENALGF